MFIFRKILMNFKIFRKIEINKISWRNKIKSNLNFSITQKNFIHVYFSKNFNEF